MTRTVLRPIGSPFPLGFFTVAFNSVLVGAVQWDPRRELNAKERR